MVVEGQAISKRAPFPEGRVWVFHVDPPFVVPTTAPTPTPGREVYGPTASHVVADGQAMPVSVDIPEGRVWVFHVVPPSVVLTTLALFAVNPTA